ACRSRPIPPARRARAPADGLPTRRAAPPGSAPPPACKRDPWLLANPLRAGGQSMHAVGRVVGSVATDEHGLNTERISVHLCASVFICDEPTAPRSTQQAERDRGAVQRGDALGVLDGAVLHHLEGASHRYAADVEHFVVV